MKRSPIQRKTPMKRTGKPLARSRLNPVSKDPKKRKANAEYEAAKRKWRAGHDGQCEARWGTNCETGARVYIEHVPFDEIGMHSDFDRSWMTRCKARADKNPHHIKGRGRFLSDASTFMGVCLACHDWIDTHRRQATALGYFVRTNPNPDR